MMRLWMWFVFLLVTSVYGLLGSHAATTFATTKVVALCFEHIGPQDKPMPAFCISESGAAPKAMEAPRTPKMQWIQLGSAPWQKVLGLIEQEGTKDIGQRPIAFGQYEVKIRPTEGVRYLSVESMRQVTRILGTAKGLNSPQSEMIQRLKLRLG